MSDFLAILKRLRAAAYDRQRGVNNGTAVVRQYDLRELLRHFDRLDHEARSTQHHIEVNTTLHACDSASFRKYADQPSINDQILRAINDVPPDDVIRACYDDAMLPKLAENCDQCRVKMMCGRINKYGRQD